MDIKQVFAVLYVSTHRCVALFAEIEAVERTPAAKVALIDGMKVRSLELLARMITLVHHATQHPHRELRQMVAEYPPTSIGSLLEQDSPKL